MLTLPFWRERPRGKDGLGMLSGVSVWIGRSSLPYRKTKAYQDSRQKLKTKTQDKSLSRHKTKAYQDSRQKLKTKTQDKNKRLKTKAYQDKSLSRQKPIKTKAYQDKSLSRQKTRWSNVKTKTTGISHTHSSI